MSLLGEKFYCNINGSKITYYKCGKGQPVLLIHGITTYSFIWRNIVPVLKDHFEVYSLDLVGCGDSDKPLDISYSLENHSKIIYEFVEKQQLVNLHLIGHDLGGGISQIFTVHHENLLKTLTLINSVAYDYWPVQPIITMQTPIIRQFAMAALDIGAFKLIVKRGMYHKDKVDNQLMKLFWLPLMTREGRKAFLHFAKCLDNNDLLKHSGAIAKFTLPVSIIRGDNDVYLSSSIAEKLNSEIKGSKLLRISTAGHFIQEDEPRLLADSILEFLLEHNG